MPARFAGRRNHNASVPQLWSAHWQVVHRMLTRDVLKWLVLFCAYLAVLWVCMLLALSPSVMPLSQDVAGSLLWALVLVGITGTALLRRRPSRRCDPAPPLP